jgi:hypothetical protein
MAAFPLAACPTLRTVTSIGEKLPDAVADAWCAPGVVSVNMYGPAEAAIVSTGALPPPRLRARARAGADSGQCADGRSTTR